MHRIDSYRQWLLEGLIIILIYLWRAVKFFLLLIIWLELDGLLGNLTLDSDLYLLSFMAIYGLTVYFLYTKLAIWKHPKVTEDLPTEFWYGFEVSFVIFVSLFLGRWLEPYPFVGGMLSTKVVPALFTLMYVDTRTSFTKNVVNRIVDNRPHR